MLYLVLQLYIIKLFGISNSTSIKDLVYSPLKAPIRGRNPGEFLVEQDLHAPCLRVGNLTSHIVQADLGGSVEEVAGGGVERGCYQGVRGRRASHQGMRNRRERLIWGEVYWGRRRFGCELFGGNFLKWALVEKYNQKRSQTHRHRRPNIDAINSHI